MRSLIVERREVPRLAPGESLVCTVVDPQDGATYPARLLDISPFGLAFVADHRFQVELLLIVLVHNPHNHVVLCCHAQVSHVTRGASTDSSTVGCEFSQSIDLEEFAQLLA